jgi:DNA-binding transcriptional regulator YdaS (Cro superfamily)
MTLQLTTDQIINLLGGTSRVAKMCNVAPAAVAQWKDSTIPSGRMIYLAATLEEKSHGLITRKDLFPRGWQIIWPELVNKQ